MCVCDLTKENKTSLASNLEIYKPIIYIYRYYVSSYFFIHLAITIMI